MPPARRSAGTPPAAPAAQSRPPEASPDRPVAAHPPAPQAGPASAPMLPGMNGCSTVAITRSASTSTRSTAPSAPDRSAAAPRAPGDRYSHWRHGRPSRHPPAPRGTPAGPAARAAQPGSASAAASSSLSSSVSRPPARQPALAVARDQRQRALRQVAEVVRQLDVDPRDQRLVRQRAVAAERLLAQQEIAHLIEPEGRHQLPRLDDVAERLAHLLAVDRPPAVRGHPLRHRQPGGHQERRPVDGMESQDILADEVRVRWPVLPPRCGLVRKAAGRDVVVQRIQPDIHHVPRRARHRNAPGEAGAADRQVPQPAAHEAQHLVAAAGGRMKSGSSSYSFNSLSCHSDSLKKYEGSLTHSTGAPLGATLLPSGRVVSSSSS